MTDLSGFEATAAMAAASAVAYFGRRAGRYWRWARAEARRRRDWLAQTEAAYRAEVAAAQRAAAARDGQRALRAASREVDAAALRPFTTHAGSN